MLHVISLGAGVQSTTLALMAAHGEITPMPDCAIFADTQWEPKAVYQHLDWLTPRLPFPVYIVTGGDLRADTIAMRNSSGGAFAQVPWHIRMNDGKKTMGRRQCTYQYKLRPIQRKIVELVGGRPKGGTELWLGISTDEIMRVRPSRVRYIVNRHPLIEKRISRGDCIEWLKRNGFPIPTKSACIGCPFHHAAYWGELRSRPDEWRDAVEVDAAIRNQSPRGQQFMAQALKPLDQIDLSTAEDRGQLNLFNNECEGMCGV